MGVTVLVLGRSGAGKSTALRNFEYGEVGVFNVMNKPLPFKKQLLVSSFDTDEGDSQSIEMEYATIEQSLKDNKLRAYVIDDSTYLMEQENMRRAKEKGYDKFTDIAQHFSKLLEIALHTSKDTIVYFLHHSDMDDLGREKVKSIGKMLDEKYCIEGTFPIVIDCIVRDGQHLFVTTNDGINIAKAPIDMLPAEMDNDLKAVDTLIRDYWDMAPLTNITKKEESKNAKS